MNDPMWTTGAKPNRLAALPSGWLGRLGGWWMARGNLAEQLEVLETARITRDDSVLEVGVGPGVLVERLHKDYQPRRVVALDPSAEMREMAARRNAAAIAAGRLSILPGSAAATGQPDGEFDVVLSVNTVAIWPDLAAGVTELARVTRPDGRLLLSWHGGTEPSRMARPLILPEGPLELVRATLAQRFGAVERLRTTHCEIFRVVRAT